MGIATKNVVLGIGAFGHDASAALIEKETGKVVFALAEERITNVKHDAHFPIGTIQTCEEVAMRQGMSITDIAVNFAPADFINGRLVSVLHDLQVDSVGIQTISKTLNEIFLVGDICSPNSFSFELISQEIKRTFKDRTDIRKLKNLIAWCYNTAQQYKYICNILAARHPNAFLHLINHHLCHAASAYFGSGFERATIVTIDGFGEYETSTIQLGSQSGIERISASIWPHSLGSFYYNATRYLGYDLGDEYKVMGMAAYGQAKFYEELRHHIVVDENGIMHFNESQYFKQTGDGYGAVERFDFTESFQKFVPKRRSMDGISQIHFDFAASIQKITEEVAVEIVKKAIEITGESRVALAGGVALNGLMNEQIFRRCGVSDLFIYPASGDDGTSIGAAQYAAFEQSKFRTIRIQDCYFGGGEDDAQIDQALQSANIVYRRPDSIETVVANALADNKIVARYNGRSEFGPRALGNRSILANPCNADMKDVINERIKHREAFRPFAPVCLYERVGEYFEVQGDAAFMLLIVKALPRAAKEIPAVVHQDGTARVQTIKREQNQGLYEIIKEFEKITGVPVLINTSFNVNGEAIVETAMDAIESFGHMDIDYLAIGPFWVSKAENMGKFDHLTDSQYLEKRRSRFLTKHGVWPLSKFYLPSHYLATWGEASLAGKILSKLKHFIS